VVRKAAGSGASHADPAAQQADAHRSEMKTMRGAKAAADAHRRLVTHGEHRTFHVRYRPCADGFAFEVRGLPGVTGTTTARKGLLAAASQRIALELDVPRDAFGVELD
jgi:hypothetical protein